mmetsp:Transcript_21017/g.65126  ORF Transcript_21017/g.65126 Transcript_21017/m.65126 type:complete len:273 (-) Transcript_21017:801-1619(-)
MDGGVAVVIPRRHVDALGHEPRADVVVAPEGSLVQRCAPAARLARVHVAAQRSVLLHQLKRAVHGVLAQLGALACVRRGGRAAAARRQRCEGAAVRAGLRPRTQSDEAAEGVRKVLEEGGLVTRVELDVLAEGLVVQQRHVRREHHQLPSGLVGVLLRAVPLALDPLVVQQVGEVCVVELERVVRPLAVKARARRVAPPQRVRARERDDVAVRHAHAVEDVAEVGGALRRVGQAPVCDAYTAASGRRVGAPEGEGHLGAAHELDAERACERP